MTEHCLDRLLEQNLPPRRASDPKSATTLLPETLEVHILLIDNQSKQPFNLDVWQRRADAKGWTLSLYTYDAPFNYARMHNCALASVPMSNHDVIFFLNNDVFFPADGAGGELEKLLDFYLSTPKIAALGCTLLYPNAQIQHLCLAPGVKIGGSHPFKHYDVDDLPSWFAQPQPVAAVTGAAMLVSRHHFNLVGGFDEQLGIACQDLDLCLKLQEQGLHSWSLPEVKLIHQESMSRGHKHLPVEDYRLLYERWGSFLKKNPSWPDHLSTWSETPCYRWREGAYPWQCWLNHQD